MIVWAWIVKNWGWLWKVLATIGAALLLWWVSVTILGWKADSEQLPIVVAQAKVDLAAAQKKLDNLQAQYDNAYKASKGYQDELQNLRDDIAHSHPAPVIRVCKPASLPRPVTSGIAPARPDAAAPATGDVQEETRFDTSPLYGELADPADALAAQVRGLQTFVQNRKCSE